MTSKIDLGKFPNSKFSVSVESELETKARIERENQAAQAKLLRSNIDLALLSIISLACLWYGLVDTSDAQRALWCRTALLAVVSYLIGRQVGKSDGST